MKRFKYLILLTLLVPIAGISQNNGTFIDDIYYKPSDIKIVQSTPKSISQTKKNGAKEIVFIERQIPIDTLATDTLTSDTLRVLAQANDST